MVMSIKNKIVIARSVATMKSVKVLEIASPTKVGFAMTIQKIFGEIK
jgi:hypothetical protein